VIGVDVRFEHGGNRPAMLGGELHVRDRVDRRIHHGGFAFAADHIR
jgi:hypothetical protein